MPDIDLVAAFVEVFGRDVRPTPSPLLDTEPDDDHAVRHPYA